MNNVIYTVTIWLTMVHIFTVHAYREHKVHNIVLYPDKHSWCKTTTIKQVISYPGCTSVEIDNNVCVGACFSYSIPHTEPSDPGEVITPYCDSCQPLGTTWHQITLQCNKNDEDVPSQLLKHVQIIENCSCTPCEKDSHGVSKFPENNEDLLLEHIADAELLQTLQKRNESSFNNMHTEHVTGMNYLLRQKLANLLNDIQVNNTEQDKEQLLELLNIFHEPFKNKIKDNNLIEFIENSQSNKTNNLNTTRLIELLIQFGNVQRYFNIPKDDINQTTVLNADTEKEEVSSTIENVKSNTKEDTALKENIPLVVWPSASEKVADTRHHDDVRDETTEKNFLEEEGITQNTPHTHLSHPNSHQHHLSDNIVSMGHLARGPHGALVIEPDRKHEEKLDVNAFDLKPNHAGTLLSYHSHSGEGNAHK